MSGPVLFASQLKGVVRRRLGRRGRGSRWAPLQEHCLGRGVFACGSGRCWQELMPVARGLPPGVPEARTTTAARHGPSHVPLPPLFPPASHASGRCDSGRPHHRGGGAGLRAAPGCGRRRSPARQPLCSECSAPQGSTPLSVFLRARVCACVRARACVRACTH